MSRVALVVPHLGCGGSEQSLFRLGRALAARGHAVELVVTERSGEWFARAADLGLSATQIPGRDNTHPLRHAWRVGAHLKAGGFDAVLLNNVERFAQSALNMLPDSVCAIPVVRSDNPHAYEVACSHARAWNVLVAVSPKTQAEARRRVPHKPVVFIPNGVDQAPVAARRDRPGHARPLQLLYVGRLEHMPKGVLHLPAMVKAALSRGLGVHLTCIGDGRDAGALRAAIREAGVDAHVTLPGTQAPEEVYRRLLAAHVLLAPSIFEGLPGAPLEAQACGCVPIASRLPGITDVVIRDGETGLLVDGGTVAGFVAAIERLHGDAALWTRLSDAGTAHVRDNFSIDAMGDAYARLLTDAKAGAYVLPRPRRGLLPIRVRAFRWWELFPEAWRPSRRARRRMAPP